MKVLGRAFGVTAIVGAAFFASACLSEPEFVEDDVAIEDVADEEVVEADVVALETATDDDYEVSVMESGSAELEELLDAVQARAMARCPSTGGGTAWGRIRTLDRRYCFLANTTPFLCQGPTPYCPTNGGACSNKGQHCVSPGALRCSVFGTGGALRGFKASYYRRCE